MNRMDALPGCNTWTLGNRVSDLEYENTLASWDCEEMQRDKLENVE